MRRLLAALLLLAVTVWLSALAVPATSSARQSAGDRVQRPVFGIFGKSHLRPAAGRPPGNHRTRRVQPSPPAAKSPCEGIRRQGPGRTDHAPSQESEKLYKDGKYNEAAALCRELTSLSRTRAYSTTTSPAWRASLATRTPPSPRWRPPSPRITPTSATWKSIRTSMRSTTRPAWKELLKSRDDIQAASTAKRFADALQKQLGEDCTCQIDDANRLIFALSRIDAQTLADIKSYLRVYAIAMSKDMFTHSPEQYVAIVVPKDGVIKQASVPRGFYNSAEHMLLARTIGSVLTHEFTHALHAADMEAMGQQHPIWIIEGLATVYENSAACARTTPPCRGPQTSCPSQTSG